MKLLFLGSASGLGVNAGNFQSNMLLITNSGKKLLIDCGTDIRFSLTKAKYKPDDIDAVFVSHLHADHIGGLEWFALQRRYVCKIRKPMLIINKQLAVRLWNHSLSGGLQTLEHQEATLEDYFFVEAVEEGQSYNWEGMQLHLIRTIHVHSNEELVPSYGLEINYKGKTFLITTDTQFTPELFSKYYQRATLIFHDCETSKTPSTVHAHYNQLITLDPAVKAKTWLYHYNDGELPDAKAQGFLGFIYCNQIVDLV